MAQAKKVASLRASIANYKFDTSGYITLKPLTPSNSAPSNANKNLQVRSQKPASTSKAKSNA